MSEKWEFYVAGVQHHQLKYCIGNVEEGDEIHIVPEPTNPYDSNAVQLHWKGEDTDFMVGFVPKKKDMNVQVSASLEIGTNLRCKVVKLDRSAKPWEQLRVVIEESKMSKMAEDFINGFYCKYCGVVIDGKEPGHSRLCKYCESEKEEEKEEDENETILFIVW